jgi:hypothetical protein
MAELSLQAREREVEAARARLTANLALLRAPDTFSNFTDGLKQEALNTKDAWIDSLKAKAAANPAATLAIGAGLAWRLFRNPPIASALVGLGLFSLLRTSANARRRSTAEYLEEGKRQLKQQGGAFLDKARDVAADTQQKVSDRLSALADTANEQMELWRGQAAEAAERTSAIAQQITSDVTEASRQSAADATSRARRATGQASSQIQDFSAAAYDQAERFTRSAAATGQRLLQDEETRDNVLLGVAGAAVVAALGIACQKRIAQREDA